MISSVLGADLIFGPTLAIGLAGAYLILEGKGEKRLDDWIDGALERNLQTVERAQFEI